MRTRRSPRNQERLWKELGGSQKPGTVKKPLTPEEEIERTQAMLDSGMVNRKVRKVLEERLEKARARIRVCEALSLEAASGND